MYTRPDIEKTIKDNTDKKEMFQDIYETLQHIDISEFSTKNISGTEVRYFHIGINAFHGSSFTRTIDLGNSHSERYYLIIKNGNLEAIIASETGGGYLQRGQSAYFIDLYTLYGEVPFSLKEISSMSDFHDKVKNFVGTFNSDIENIEDLSDKDLKSFLRSAFSFNYGKTPVFFGTTSNNKKYITSSSFLSLFRSKMKSKIKDFKLKYPESRYTYVLSESDKEILSFLNDRFINQLSISFDSSITDVNISGELFDYLYKDKFSELDYYYYYYDKNLDNLFSLFDDKKIDFYLSSSDTLVFSSSYKEPLFAFIDSLEKTLRWYSDTGSKKSINNILEIIDNETKQIEKNKSDFFEKVESKLNKYFSKLDISYSTTYIDNSKSDSQLEIEIKINSIDEI